MATYPDDGILLRKSDMILAAHVDAGILNESRARSRAGAHIFLPENNPKPELNGPVLKISQIIKTVMASAAEAEMVALYITAKKLCHCVIHSLKWVGHNLRRQSKQTTQQR